MSKIPLIFLALIFISSCGIKEEAAVVRNPYPSLPLGATSMPTTPGKGDNYEVFGTEPFWNVKITATGTTFIRPDETGMTSKTYETRQEERNGSIVIKDPKGEFFVILKKGSCNDGMSNKRYYFSANVSLGSENLKGCANKD